MDKPNIRFVPKDKKNFTQTLRKRVDAYFKENNIPRTANSHMVIKSITMISMYVLPFIAYLVFQPNLFISILLFILMGLGLAGIGMGVMHDAAHGSYSKNPKINYLMAHTLNLAGGSVINWQLQHNVLHHTFTNITHYDDDIMDRPLLRFSPHARHFPHQRFQHLYAWFFYGILTLYWVVAKDFVQFHKYNKEGVNTQTKSERNLSLSKMIVTKLIYYFIFLVVPIAFFDIPWHYTVIGFLSMHFVAGLLLSLVFQLAHTVDSTQHPMPNEDFIVEDEWAIHQLKTTMNFARNNKLVSWYVGGLNQQVEHHLFPNICHVHYPAIAPIVKQTAEEFGVEYLEKETFFEAVVSHVSMLKSLGRNEVALQKA